MTLLVFPPFYPQILMNVQWIQAHVVQERVWIWMAPTGVSALPVTICMRKPVKVQQTEIFFFRLSLQCTCVHAAAVHKKKTNHFFQPPPSLQLPRCYKSPFISFFSCGRGPEPVLVLFVYTVGLMRRYSADFNTFLMCSLLGRRDSSSTFSAKVT